MSIRINKNIACHIANLVTVKTYNAKIDDLNTKSGLMGDRLYDRFIEPHKSLIGGLPRSFFSTWHSATFGVFEPHAGDKLFLQSKEVDDLFLNTHNHTGQIIRFSCEQVLPIASQYGGSFRLAFIANTNEDLIEYLRLRREYTDTMSEKDNAFNTIKNTISGISTIAKLIEAWPEIEEILPPEYLEKKKSLPAVQIKTIKDMLKQVA